MRLALGILLLSSVARAEGGVELAPARPAPPPPTEQSPYFLRLDIDLPLLLLGTTLWGGTSVIGVGSTPPPWCGSSTTAPCNASSVNALDRAAIGFYSPSAATAGNVLVGVLPAAFTALDIVDAGFKNWRGWLTDAVVITEAVVWSGAMQDIVRRAVRRPRPYMYVPGLNPSGRDGPEADFSFFSGHTSNLFAMVTAAAFTYNLRHPHSKWRWLVWSLAVAGESAEPVLRVLSGDHFPTDCIVGALVGTTAGILFPALHRRRIPIRIVSSDGHAAGTTVGVAGALVADPHVDAEADVVRRQRLEERARAERLRGRERALLVEPVGGGAHRALDGARRREVVAVAGGDPRARGARVRSAPRR